MSENTKKELLAQCIEFIDNKYKTLQSEYKLYQESAANETKSTAGDKHDTSKSMMQLEQEKLGHQLNLLLQQRKILENMDVKRSTGKIEFGAVVETDQGNFFISIGAREIQINGQVFIPVSIQSPLAKILDRHVVNDAIKFNNKTYTINAVY
jgi:transcription elongation GreA/GreB family factor